MKKAVRIYLTGDFQVLFFNKFIQENAERNDIRGFCRTLEDGRIELFIEGDQDKVEKMTEACKTGQKHTKIENAEVKEEKFQGFREFKILHI